MRDLNNTLLHFSATLLHYSVECNSHTSSVISSTCAVLVFYLDPLRHRVRVMRLLLSRTVLHWSCCDDLFYFMELWGFLHFRTVVCDLQFKAQEGCVLCVIWCLYGQLFEREMTATAVTAGPSAIRGDRSSVHRALTPRLTPYCYPKFHFIPLSKAT